MQVVLSEVFGKLVGVFLVAEWSREGILGRCSEHRCGKLDSVLRGIAGSSIKQEHIEPPNLNIFYDN